MNERGIIIFICFILAACAAKNKEQEAKVAYDEAALKGFVLASADSNKGKSLNLLDSILVNASKDSAVFRHTVSFLEEPLSDPNSPYRNENLFSELLQAKIKSSWVDSTAANRSREKLYLLMQNKSGFPANDFTYITPAGYK